MHTGRTPQNRMAEDCQGRYLCSGGPTCGDRVIDYFVVSECPAQAWAIVAACVIGDQTFGPHSPVRLIVKANSRTVMVRELKVPGGFTANLPFGPMPLTGCPSVLCGSEGNVVPQVPPLAILGKGVSGTWEG